jgi:NADH-quinone oxidoreductase subunit I
MLTYFKNVFRITSGLLTGLKVTWLEMFQPKVTLQYPYEKPKLSDRFRGMLTFHIDECIACDLCVRACPSNCIALVSERNAAGKKEIQNYTIDFGKCNWCRLCEEACPTPIKSVHHTDEYEMMFMSRDDFKITWTKNAKGEPLEPINAAGKPMKPWGHNPELHMTEGIGANKPGAAAATATPAA